jgi:hypothetical protein
LLDAKQSRHDHEEPLPHFSDDHPQRNNSALVGSVTDGRTHLNCRIIRAVTREETAMGTIGAVFQPELIELMKSALEEAAAILPKAKRTSSMKVKLASRILAAAAKGERDPIQLRIAALLETVDV